MKTPNFQNLYTLSAPQQSPYERILKEFRESAIPDRLTKLNIGYDEGESVLRRLTEEAIAQCQKVTSYVTEPAKRILKRYEFAAEGGWFARCAEVFYFKPFKPRFDFHKGKHIKYETPEKCEASPIFPWVDEETAAEIYERHGVSPLPGEEFWDVVWRYNLTIAVVEGLKKALSLIAHGKPAIAIRGIYNWRVKGTDQLHPTLAYFATLNRTVHIVFDQDSKPKTRQAVRQQALKLGNAFALSGCKVRIPAWKEELGKGIDDVLYGQKEGAQAWLDACLENALSLNDYKRFGWTTGALEIISRFNKLTYPVERSTEGEYLPEFPHLQQGAIHVLNAGMDSGKTYRTARDWVRRDAIERGWNALILVPTNNLGQQTAKDAGLPHIHDYPTTEAGQQALWADVSRSHGVVMCPDSLHRIPDWFWDRPVLLILDEANQGCDHITEGNTFGDRYSEIVGLFAEAARRAIVSGAIVLSEDGVTDRTVNLVKQLSGASVVRVFQHQKQGKPWNATVYKGAASGFRAQMIQSIEQGNRLLVVASSQAEAKRTQRALTKLCPGKKIDRIDSETNQKGEFREFFTDPDNWLIENQPDVLIVTPSVKSGVSIQGGVDAKDAYFDEVWGYFPCLATDTHYQMLGRFRPNVPRFVFVPPFIQTTADESLRYPRAMQRRRDQDVAFLTRLYGLDEMDSDHKEEIESAIFTYLNDSRSVRYAQKSVAHDALVSRLEQAGHIVTLEKLGKDKAVSAFWKAIQEEVWREEATELAEARVNPEIQTSTWANKTLNSMDVSREVRIIAQKILLQEQFPGFNFSDPERCYQAVFVDNGAMKRGALMQARAENIEATKDSDRQKATAILSDPIRALHKLPRNFAKAMLVSEIGILALADGSTYDKGDPRVLAVKKTALWLVKEIRYFFRLAIKEDQTPIEICNKLLKSCLKLEPKSVARVGRRDARKRIYQADNPIRCELLKAARSKLSGVVSMICNREFPPPITNHGHGSEPPSREEIEDLRSMWEIAGDAENRQWMIEAYPPELLRSAIGVAA